MGPQTCKVILLMDEIVHHDKYDTNPLFLGFSFACVYTYTYIYICIYAGFGCSINPTTSGSSIASATDALPIPRETSRHFASTYFTQQLCPLLILVKSGGVVLQVLLKKGPL